MRIGPFTLAGRYDHRHAQMVAEVAAFAWRWALLLREARRWGRDSIEVVFDLDAFSAPSNLAEYHRGQIRMREGLQGLWSHHFAHEVGHVVDAALFHDARHLRDRLHEAMHLPDGHTHLASSNREASSGEHAWSFGSATLHRNSPAEAFAWWWAWRLGADDRTSHGRHGWDTPQRRQAVAEIVDGRVEEVAVFDDIEGSAHEQAIEWAAAQGIVSGFDDGTFRPGEFVTRGQLASILFRLHGGTDVR